MCTTRQHGPLSVHGVPFQSEDACGADPLTQMSFQVYIHVDCNCPFRTQITCVSRKTILTAYCLQRACLADCRPSAPVGRWARCSHWATQCTQEANIHIPSHHFDLHSPNHLKILVHPPSRITLPFFADVEMPTHVHTRISKAVPRPIRIAGTPSPTHSATNRFARRGVVTDYLCLIQQQIVRRAEVDAVV